MRPIKTVKTVQKSLKILIISTVDNFLGGFNS